MYFPNADVVVNPALLLLLGLMVGTLSGFFGVGGGFLITGGLLVFGVPPVFAVGTGLTLIMGSAMINTLKHRSFGNVDYRLGLFTLAGALPAVVIAERLNSTLEGAGVSGPVIRLIYVVLLAVVGGLIVFEYLHNHMARRQNSGQVATLGLAQRVQALRIPPHSINIPGLRPIPTYVSLPVSRINRISVFLLIGVGFAVGFYAGLLGAGGGFILMPLYIYVLGIPTTVAIGTDLFQVVITGSLGTFLYSLSNHVDLLMALIMLASASAGAQLGATATRFVEAARIRILFGLTILSGSVAVALEHVSQSISGAESLSTLASIVLLGVAGVICFVIVAMVVRNKRHSVEEHADPVSADPTG